MADDFTNRIQAFFAQHAITDYHFEQRGKHRAVNIHHNGHSHTVFFPCTGSDCRGAANCISVLRHELGLVNQHKCHAESIRRRARRHGQKASVHAMRRLLAGRHEKAGPSSDKFYGPLAELRIRLMAFETPSAPANEAGGDGMIGEHGARATGSSDGLSGRIRLRTPWLGRRVRYSGPTYHYSAGGAARCSLRS